MNSTKSEFESTDPPSVDAPSTSLDKQQTGDASLPSQLLSGQRIAFIGKLGGLNRKEAAKLVRKQGGITADHDDDSLTMIVIGADELPLDAPASLLSSAQRTAVAEGRCQVLSETQLWERLGLLEDDSSKPQLYTPAMLAQLADVSVATVRRWHRRNLIVPVREIRKLPYFDFQEVANARRIAKWIASGMSPAHLESKLEQLAEWLPNGERPLAQLSILIEGKDVLLRQGEGLIEPGGQLRIDFDALENDTSPEAAPDVVSFSPRNLLVTADTEAGVPSLQELQELAQTFEESGELDQAIEVYHSLAMANGPQAESCFQLAELLYRVGDLGAARERYFMAIELDDGYVEARANLGCVLAELGDRELAIAAFRGTLRYHPDYPDVHFHLARLLDEMGFPLEAVESWHRFLELSPNSPWADEARARLGLEPSPVFDADQADTSFPTESDPIAWPPERK